MAGNTAALFKIFQHGQLKSRKSGLFARFGIHMAAKYK